MIQKTNKVYLAKKKEVQKLMAFFEVPRDVHDFYEDVLAAADNKGPNTEPDTKGPDIEPDTYDDQETVL